MATTIALTKGEPISSAAHPDDITAEAITAFDYTWEGSTSFEPYEVPDLPRYFNLGVIVGTSGSGKSTLLKAMGGAAGKPHWTPDRTIVSHFDSAEQAIERLTAVGLGSVPVWCKPYSVLSNGERFRADLARQIQPGARIDEFSSVVDRHVAMATSRGLSRYLRSGHIGQVVLATCHRDVLPWLEPDWIIDTDAGIFVTDPKEWLPGASLVVEVHRCKRDAWAHFAEHHYLASSLHGFARCYLATWEDEVVGFSAAIPFPHGSIKGAWRETRTVILPEFQGLGLGVRLSDQVAALHKAEGYRYFSRTQHPRMGEYRQRSPLWKPTSSNLKRAAPPVRDALFAHWKFDANRVAYSHEYIGPPSEERDPLMPSPEQRAKSYKYKKKAAS